MGVNDFVFELSASKAKIMGVFHWSHGNLLSQNNKQFLTIILISNDTILLTLSDTELLNNSIKRQGL